MTLSKICKLQSWLENVNVIQEIIDHDEQNHFYKEDR